MQCFERQAMYLKLYADITAEIPGFEFDADLLDEALFDFGIDRFDTLMALEDGQRLEIVNHFKSVTATERGFQDERTTEKSEFEFAESSRYAVPHSVLRSNPTLSRTAAS